MLRNGLYNVGGAAWRMALSIVTVPLLIRLIGIENYGVWVLVTAGIGIVALAEAGLSITTTVFVSQDLAKSDREGLAQTLTVTVGAMLVLATLAGIVYAAGAFIFPSLFPDLTQVQREVMGQAMVVGGVVIWVQLMQRVLIGVEQAYQRYAVLNGIMTVEATLRSAGLLAIAAAGGGIVEFMQWQAVVSGSALLAHGVIVWRLLPRDAIRLSWSRTRGQTIARYSVLTWVSSIGGTLFSQGDRLIVGRILGPGALGVYAAITTVTQQINLFSALPVQPFLPVLSGLWAAQEVDRAALKQRLRQAYQTNAFFALGLGGALVTFAPLVMRLMVPGEDSGQTILAFQVAVVIYALYSLNAVGYYALLGLKAVLLCATIQLVSGVVALALISVGALEYGLIGAVIGNIGFTITLLHNNFSSRKLELPKSLWLRWLSIPLGWFVMTIITGSFMSQAVQVQIPIFIALVLVITTWFFRQIWAHKDMSLRFW